MKKLALVFASVFCFAIANAQFSLGLQGGYLTQKNTHTLDDAFSKNAEWIGGLQLGYMVTPKLYVGVMFGLNGNSNENSVALDSIYYLGQMIKISDRKFAHSQSGWTVAPIARYEFLRYGNMHFNVMLQGNVSSMGYTTITESYYYVSKPTPGEFIQLDDVCDSVSTFTWGISLRPTLVYDFSQHLNIELCLDFLSVGYVDHTVSHDATVSIDPLTGDATRFDAYETNTTKLYAGLNTLVDALHWESPMLRLGVNYIF